MIVSFTPHIKIKHLLGILGIKAIVMIGLILYAGIGLGPDEAQYWTWSRTLDWGYYSKPPGIAWQIWLGTQFFGQTEWGVRSLTVVIAIFQSLAIYQLALKANLLPRTAFWCGLLMALSPLGILGSFFAITDVGFLLCWTGACLSLTSAFYEKQTPNPILIGLWIMLGALFKWPIYVFWIFYLLMYIRYFPQEKKRYLFIGGALSLIGLLPSVWWNISHDWATFRHVSATLQGGSGARAEGNLGEFLGSQALLLSPIIFILLLIACWKWNEQRKQLSPALFFCGLVTCSSLLLGCLLAYMQKMQGNWLEFAYPTGLILIGWLIEKNETLYERWVKIGLGFSVVLATFVFILPAFYVFPGLKNYAPPYRLMPFKHNLGWNKLSQVLIEQGYRSDQHFLVSDKYQTTSLLSFYPEGQQRAYFLNLQGIRNNQFSYWPGLQEEREGQTGYFVWTENLPNFKGNISLQIQFYQNELEKYFEKVEFLERATLIEEKSHPVKVAFIFRCQACKDFLSQPSLLY